MFASLSVQCANFNYLLSSAYREFRYEMSEYNKRNNNNK